MGRVRKFTQETYDALKNGAEDKEGAWAKMTDFFGDIKICVCNAFNGVALEDDFSNFSTYLRDVADINDYTSTDIDNIFRAVDNVEYRYENMLGTSNQQMKDYVTIVKKLKEAISDVNFTQTYSTESFLASVSLEMQSLIGVQWKSILNKDVEDITEEEFNMIAMYLIQSGDEELLEDMVIQCYEIVEPDAGIKNPTVYQDATGHIVEKYHYRASDKFDMLAAAVKRVAVVWSTIDQDWEEGAVELRWIHTAMQYDSFFSTMQQHEDLVMVTETANYGNGTRRYMNEKLIDITYNPDESICVEMYPYLSQAMAFTSEVSGKTVATVSRANADAAGQDSLIEHAFTYVNAYMGIDAGVTGAMTEETANQLISGLLGMIPHTSGPMAAVSILQAGEEAVEKEVLMNRVTETAGWGRIVDEFSLVCVEIDTDQDVSKYAVSIYASADTQKKIDAYNTFMEQNPDAARMVGYPEEGISMADIMTPNGMNELVELFNVINKEDYEFGISSGVEEIYIEERARNEKES